MKRSIIFLLLALIYLPSCNKDETLAEAFSPSPKGDLFFRSEDLETIKTRFKGNLEAALTLEANALKNAIRTQVVALPQNITESQALAIQTTLISQGFLDEAALTAKLTLVNQDLHLLSSLITQPEVNFLMTSTTQSALSVNAGSSAMGPCYENYETSMGIAITAWAGCIYFSGGFPGGVVCTAVFAVTAALIDEQFDDCMHSTYPGAYNY